jgi:DNA ligase-associated metallophosphoesterase
LDRLAALFARYAVRIVVALGDNFHDGGGPARLAHSDRAHLFELQRGRDWVWIAGNHDPDPREDIGGAFARSLALGPLTFRHEPAAARGQGGNGDLRDGEIAGHLHPAARIYQRGRTLTRKCFATDGARLVMPAFGAYTGGLNIRDVAFLKVFGALGFTAHLIGQRRLYAFAAARCLAD